ncbi:MAG: hypothetical protein HC838_15220 [Spirulinaceae cyanobacterium RM2_2_10]|nr:hypothetical protein [Spirulinaceae cyanobacterium RM2_2_10]
MRLKRWESPRRQGRNAKGRGGSARARQLRKQQQHLRRKLKQPQLPSEPGSGTSLPVFGATRAHNRQRSTSIG